MTWKAFFRATRPTFPCAINSAKTSIPTIFFLFSFVLILWRMRKNKAQAHHTSTMFSYTSCVDLNSITFAIQLVFWRVLRFPRYAGFLACPSVPAIGIARAVPTRGPRYTILTGSPTLERSRSETFGPKKCHIPTVGKLETPYSNSPHVFGKPQRRNTWRNT